jgi:hypothetical protein
MDVGLRPVGIERLWRFEAIYKSLNRDPPLEEMFAFTLA